MANSPINKKTFSLTVIQSKTFSVFINGFQYATSMFFRIFFKIPITFVGSALAKISPTINVKRVRLVISQMKLITKITQTISAKRVRVTVFYRERGKIATTIYGRLRITPVLKAIQKSVSNINLRKVILTISPTLAQFFTLGVYDPTTLGTQDTKTLGQMDYTT